jgi:hypothetical protein
MEDAFLDLGLYTKMETEYKIASHALIKKVADAQKV